MFALFRLEVILPSKHALVVELSFNQSNMINIEEVKHLLEQENYHILPGFISLKYNCVKSALSLQAISQQKKNNHTLVVITNQLKKMKYISDVNLSFSRN